MRKRNASILQVNVTSCLLIMCSHIRTVRGKSFRQVVKAISQSEGKDIDMVVKTVIETTTLALGCDKVSLFQVCISFRTGLTHFRNKS